MSQSGDPSHERHLDEVIAQYLKGVDAGRSPDPARLIESFPELASDLRSFFADHERMRKLALPIRSRADDEATGGVVLDPAAATRSKLAPGDLLAGRYRIADIKSGGMGIVYLAEDLDFGQDHVAPMFAIKTVADFEDWQESRWARKVPADEAQYLALLTRFRREALAWVRLGIHPNIIHAWWVIEIGAKPHLVMEYAASGDLQQWIWDGRVTAPLALNFALQFCAGMMHAVSTSGMVHRDIKPANVLIHDDCIVKIADFGLAKVFGPVTDEGKMPAQAEQDSALSILGGGTLAYMAPEQFESLALADTRSDIYSFGVMLHEMLTSRRLFEARSIQEHRELRSRPIPPAHEINSQAPPALSKIIACCVAHDPEKRYSSFNEVSEDIRRVEKASAIRHPSPHEDRAFPAGALTPCLQIVGEAFSLISLGQFEEAARCAQRGIEIDPDYYEHWVNKGKALMELHDYAGACFCSRRATQLKPTDARSWSNLGWSLLQMGDAAAGLDAANRAIRLDAQFAEAWMCRGSSERQLHRLDDAIASLERSVELDPHNWKAHANLGFARIDAGRHGEAFPALERSLEINPDCGLCWHQLGWLHARAGAWEAARSAIDRALQLQPADAAVWALRGWIIWQGRQDRAAARACLDKALQLDPGCSQARTVLSTLESTN